MADRPPKKRSRLKKWSTRMAGLCIISCWQTLLCIILKMVEYSKAPTSKEASDWPQRLKKRAVSSYKALKKVDFWRYRSYHHLIHILRKIGEIR
jgi:hypothetical protein